MTVVPVIGRRNQTAIKTLLVCSSFVAPTSKIAWRCGSNATRLHVRVARALQGIDGRTAQVGAEVRQKPRVRQQLVLKEFVQRAQFRVEVAV